MWMQLLSFTPYIAIASSLVLAATVTAVCVTQRQPTPSTGFTA